MKLRRASVVRIIFCMFQFLMTSVRNHWLHCSCLSPSLIHSGVRSIDERQERVTATVFAAFRVRDEQKDLFFIADLLIGSTIKLKMSSAISNCVSMDILFNHPLPAVVSKLGFRSQARTDPTTICGTRHIYESTFDHLSGSPQE